MQTSSWNMYSYSSLGDGGKGKLFLHIHANDCLALLQHFVHISEHSLFHCIIFVVVSNA